MRAPRGTSGRWIPRREATGPKTIEQIRAEAKKEGIVMGDILEPRGGLAPQIGQNLNELYWESLHEPNL